MEKELSGTIKGSVYITVDKFFNPVHISMKGTGEEGFQEFMQEDVEKALKCEEMPTMGLMYYNVPDMGIVPPLQEGDNEDYLQRLEKAMDDRDGREILSYPLGNAFENVTSMTLGELYLHQGQWKFNPVGNGVHMDLAGQCALYGVTLA